MEIHCIDTEFSVCKVRDYAGIDLEGEFLFLGKKSLEEVEQKLVALGLSLKTSEE